MHKISYRGIQTPLIALIASLADCTIYICGLLRGSGSMHAPDPLKIIATLRCILGHCRQLKLYALNKLYSTLHKGWGGGGLFVVAGVYR